MKILYLLIYSTVLLLGQSAQADPLSLPSDAEMQAMGREKVGDFGTILNKAKQSVSIQPAKPVDVPPDSQIHSPIEREMMGDALDNASKLGKPSKPAGNDLILFVSFSMPDDVLKDYSEQAREAGATVVLRGMQNNSLKATQLKTYQITQAKKGAAWEVNPSLYRKFKIERVPVLVLSDGSDNLTEDGCASPTNYLRVDGEVSIRQSLLLMRRYGNAPLAKDAAQRLQKLETGS